MQITSSYAGYELELIHSISINESALIETLDNDEYIF